MRKIIGAGDKLYGNKPAGLALLWFAHATIVIILTLVNPNHFTTVDSNYYLESARNLLEGHGYTFRYGDHYIVNTHFPPGYPLSIALTAWCTGLPVLWASKMVNLLASAGMLGLFYKNGGYRLACICSHILLTGSFLKLWAHTWSEPLFLFLLTAWIFTGNRREATKSFLLGCGLILVRHAGLFIISVTLLQLFTVGRHDRKHIVAGLSAITGWLALFAAQGILNAWWTGDTFGPGRFGPRESIPFHLASFGKGLLNELLLFRDWHGSMADGLFLTGVIIQLALMYRLYRLPLLKTADVGTDDHCSRFTAVALAYLLFLAMARLISPFDPPGYRLLSPFTLLMTIAVLSRYEGYDRFPLKLRLLLIAGSWLQLWPESSLRTSLIIF